MIYGIGTDAVEVSRIQAVLARRGERFIARILGPRERVVHAARTARSPQRGLLYLATRFAAKEAISKALGLGMRQPMDWQAAQIVNARSGRPEVLADGPLGDYLLEHRLRLHISVSDLENLAIAYAIAESIPSAAAIEPGNPMSGAAAGRAAR